MILAKQITSVRDLPRSEPRNTAAVRTQPSTISIVVPVLNEAELIGRFLAHLRECAPDAEIIVADGGSTDGTREVAEKLCDEVVMSERGRPLQLNAGANAAHGDTLWFLHADSEVPRASLSAIAAALGDPRTVGGYFRIRLPKEHIVYRLTDSFAHYAGFLLRVRCGDHGFFCRRDVFLRAGGFPDVPVMEDVEFYRSMRRLGRVRAVPDRLKTSTRRYEQIGRTRLTLAYALIATLYAVGVPLRVLASIYARTCQRAAA